MTRLRKRFLDCSHMDLAEAESFGEELARQQRDVMFQLGDLARYCEARWPDTWHQAFPEWISPGLLARTAGVCRAYPKESDRVHDCTYSQYMQVAGKPDRQKLLEEMVGHTTDETRGVAREGTAGKDAPSGHGSPQGPRWLLCVDIHYFVHRWFHSGAGVAAADGVATWITRTVERLKLMGLTDVVCCFDSPDNHRKKLTESWEDKYKGKRDPKELELMQQIHVVRDLLHKAGFTCVSVDGYEADDCIASYAKHFPGKVAILSQDKDLKQCLSGERVVMLLDVTWNEDDTSGDLIAEYHWYTEKPHSRITCRNLWEDTFSKKGDEFVPPGLTPSQFIDLQCLMGDSTDCIRGAPGVGKDGARNLMHAFGSVEACIKAAHDSDPRLLGMKRGKVMQKGLLELEPKAAITRQLVTLVDSLAVPQSTRI